MGAVWKPSQPRLRLRTFLPPASPATAPSWATPFLLRPGGRSFPAPPEAPPRRRRQLLCLCSGCGRCRSATEATVAASRGDGDGGRGPQRPSERGGHRVARRQPDSRPGRRLEPVFSFFSSGTFAPRAPFPFAEIATPPPGPGRGARPP